MVKVRSWLWIFVLGAFCLGGTATGSRGAAAPVMVDSATDTRLTRRLALVSRGEPVNRVLERLAARTGVRLSAQGRVADERLIAFVPEASAAEIMLSLADLYRCKWERFNSGSQPVYRLVQGRGEVAEAQALRDECIRAGLAQMVPTPSPRGADAESSARSALRETVQRTIAAHAAEMCSAGYLSLRLEDFAAADRPAMTRDVQVLLDSAFEDVRAALSFSADNLRKTGREPSPDGDPERLVRPSLESCRFVVTLDPERGAALRIALQAGRIGDILYQGSVAETVSGMAPYAARNPRPLPGSPATTYPSPFDRSAPASSGVGRAGSWMGTLEALSVAGGVAVYSDDYEATEADQAPPAPASRTLGATLDALCGAVPEGSRGAGERRFWWNRKDAALIRSRQWVWRELAILPAILPERLSQCLAAKRPPGPQELALLAGLSLVQMERCSTVPAAFGAWVKGVQLPAHLSSVAQQALVRQGLTLAGLPANDQLALGGLPALRTSSGVCRYAAKLSLYAGHVTGSPAGAAGLNLSVIAGDDESALSLVIPLPGGRDSLVVRPKPSPAEAVASPPLVCALYYPWYATPAVSGVSRHITGVNPTGPKPSNFAHTPPAGPYDSTDPAVLMRHMKELRAAGIDVIVCSWWGPGSFEEAAVAKLTSAARQAGLKLCLLIEPYRRWPDAQALAGDLSKSLRAVIDDPAYLKRGDRPVFFVYAGARDALDAQSWVDLNQTESLGRKGPLLVIPQAAPADALLFDGVLASENAVIGGGEGPMEVREDLHPPLVVTTVTPGNPASRAADPRLSKADDQRARERAFRDSWRAALQSNASWVLIDSFNHWETGSEIEPSLEYGELFLNMSAEYSSQFRSRAASQPPR